MLLCFLFYLEVSYLAWCSAAVLPVFLLVSCGCLPRPDVFTCVQLSLVPLVDFSLCARCVLSAPRCFLLFSAPALIIVFPFQTPARVTCWSFRVSQVIVVKISSLHLPALECVCILGPARVNQEKYN